jgi:hypothetical protein
MRRIILSSVTFFALAYFFTLCHKLHDFWEKVIECEMCVLTFCATFVWNISHSEKNSATYYHKYTWVFDKVPVILCQILMNLEYSRQIFEKYSNTGSHESPLSGSRVVPCRHTHTDRQTRRRSLSLFAILRTCLKTVHIQDNHIRYSSAEYSHIQKHAHTSWRRFCLQTRPSYYQKVFHD